MEVQENINFDRIASAIAFYTEHFRDQPDLDAAAAHVHLSPFHFQRMFREWAGVTPKQFLQYISLGHAKTMLQTPGATLADTAFDTGLSGTGRLHDLFVHIEGMTPGEYKLGGANLTISYWFMDTAFGRLLAASTEKGICHIAFADEGAKAALNELHQQFPGAAITAGTSPFQQQLRAFFHRDFVHAGRIHLHLKGTPFQLKVWEALLKIPSGKLNTYSGIAEAVHSPGASRAVGSAVGANPIAYLIPCHRVIRASGAIGDYHWGSARKTAIIGYEYAKNHSLTA